MFPYTVDMAVPIFMIISGYVNAYSAEQKKVSTLKEWYSTQRMAPKLLSIIIPYLVVYVFLVTAFIVTGNVTVEGALLAFFTGGWGPGSYYIPILIQFTLLFPLMASLIKRWKWKGYVVLILFNVLFEVCFTYFDFSVEIYRLCFFRYIVFVCAEIWLYSMKEEMNKFVLSISFVIGLIYIFGVNYLGYEPKIFTNWITTSFPTVLYIFPVIAIAVLYLNKPIPQKFGGVLITIGQSTYHIYLVQMVWYSSFGNLLNPWVMLVPNVIICCLVGVIFNKIDNKIVQRPLRTFIYGLRKNKEGVNHV